MGKWFWSPMTSEPQTERYTFSAMSWLPCIVLGHVNRSKCSNFNKTRALLNPMDGKLSLDEQNMRLIVS